MSDWVVHLVAGYFALSILFAIAIPWIFISAEQQYELEIGKWWEYLNPFWVVAGLIWPVYALIGIDILAKRECRERSAKEQEAAK